MELNLLPQIADAAVFEGEGGGYYAWTPAKTPAIAQAELGAGKLLLQPRGFALPHYADTYKIGYVVQGTCTIGMVLPNSEEEKVLITKEGDAIRVPMGAISWWFNGGDSDVIIIFLGESSLSYNPGQFDYFFLTGAAAVLRGFSTEFITKIYNLNESDAEILTKSQTNALILKISAEISMPNESNCLTEEYVVNLRKSISPNVSVATAEIKMGVSANLVRLDPNSVADPSYTVDGSHRIIYVTRGGGRIQIVGLNGTRALDGAVKEGQLLVVPRFFVAAFLADDNGMEFFCVSNSPRPVLGQLSGKASAYKTLSASVLQASLNVSPQFIQLFKSSD